MQAGLACEIGADIVALQPSPSGRLTAIVRSTDSKVITNANEVASIDFVLEIWNAARRVKRFALQKLHKRFASAESCCVRLIDVFTS